MTETPLWRALAHTKFGVGAIEIDDDPEKWQGAEERSATVRGSEIWIDKMARIACLATCASFHFIPIYV